MSSILSPSQLPTAPTRIIHGSGANSGRSFERATNVRASNQSHVDPLSCVDPYRFFRVVERNYCPFVLARSVAAAQPLPLGNAREQDEHPVFGDPGTAMQRSSRPMVCDTRYPSCVLIAKSSTDWDPAAHRRPSVPGDQSPTKLFENLSSRHVKPLLHTSYHSVSDARNPLRPHPVYRSKP